MTKEAIIQKTLKTLSALPAKKAEEVANFADLVLKQYEEDILQKGLQKLTQDGEVFSFLNDEEVIYTTRDIKEKY